MKNSKRNLDNRVISVCLLGILCCLYLLYDSRWIAFFSSNSLSGEPIGEVSSFKQDVRFKNQGGFAWLNLYGQKPVAIGDSLYVGESSSAQVTLNDGTRIELSPGSLVTFKNSQGKMSLSLEFGAVKVLSQGSQKLLVEETPSVVKKDRAPAQTLTLSWKDERPILHQHYKLNKPIDIQWQSAGPFGRFKWQLAKDENFNEIVLEDFSNKKSLKIKNYPVSGKYFVRVTGANSNGEWTAKTSVRSLTILEVRKAQITSPANDSQLSLSLNADGVVREPLIVKASWSNPNHIDLQSSYEFELTNIKTKKVLLQKQETQLSSDLSFIEPGQYSIRVRAKEANSDWSDPVQFSVSKSPPAAFSRPELVGSVVEGIHTRRNAAFAWKPAPDAAKHIITIKDQLGRVIETVEKNDSKFSKDLPPGQYTAEVISLTPKNKKSPPLQFSFKSVYQAPELQKLNDIVSLVPEDSPPPPQKISLAWTPAEAASKFVIEVSKSKDFANRVVLPIENARTSEIDVPAPGTYYTRVLTLDQKNQKASAYSNVESFSYRVRKALKTPRLIEPKNKFTYFYQNNNDKEVSFEWSKVENANIYEVQMSHDAQFTNPSAAFTSPVPKLKLNADMPTGQKFWRVRAKGDLEQISNWSEPNLIVVETGRTPASR